MKKKIVPDEYFIVLIILSIIVHILIPLIKIIFFPYNLFGIFLIIAGILITVLTNYILLKNKTTTKPYDIPNVLITSGLFRLSRNPLYLGMAIILLGIEILIGSLSPFIFPIIFVIIISMMIIPIEEKNLEAKYGSKYLEYKKRVRRWI